MLAPSPTGLRAIPDPSPVNVNTYTQTHYSELVPVSVSGTIRSNQP